MANTPQSDKMSWPRILLALGFFTIMVGVVVGAATEGSVWAKYIAVAGLVPIAAALGGFLLQSLGRLRNGRQPAMK
jgi:hypothetical protein